MMSYSERRARDRASKFASRTNVMEATGSAVGSLQREVAQMIAQISELGRQYEIGAITAEREAAIYDWASTVAIPSFRDVVESLQSANRGLSDIMTR